MLLPASEPFSALERARFRRLGVTLKPNALTQESEGILNPACARLRDGTLQLYPRMVAPGNISRIGSFRAREDARGRLVIEQQGYALEPRASYELREQAGGYGCEDPRVTFIAAIDRYVMAYVAQGPGGPEVAIAVSHDGLKWERLGLVRFEGSRAPFADKDAAFFPEPVRSPAGTLCLAMYHRPTLPISVADGERAFSHLLELPPRQREGISLAYMPLSDVRADVKRLCVVTQTHRLHLPQAQWGSVKLGAGTPPVRIREGWLSIVHGVDPLAHPSGSAPLRYCAGMIVHDASRVDRVLFRSAAPIMVPQLPGEISGTVGHVVFPTAIDPRPGGRAFDIYYGMADYEIGRGRLRLAD